MSLGDNIKRLRKVKGLTQEQLGQAVGRDRTTILAIEGGREPELSTVHAIANVLGATYEELTGASTVKEESANYPAKTSDPRSLEQQANDYYKILVDGYYLTPTEWRDEYMAFIKRFYPPALVEHIVNVIHRNKPTQL